MKPLPRTHGAEELLDSPTHDPQLLGESLAHVAAVNRWLGGRRALLRTLAPRLRDGLRILDVGTGSGDLPRAIARCARRRRARVHITATDVHPQMRERAEAECRGFPEITIASADALALPFEPDRFDVVLLSMVLHHLDDDAAAAALREAARVAPLVVVNELHRTRVNHAGARVLASTVWAGNPITRHDGPLSVLRAYQPAELRALARAAGLRVLELRRRWFQRLVLVAGRA